MVLIAYLFALLLLITPPLILGGWVTLSLYFGLFEASFKWTRLLVDSQEGSVTRSKNWLVLAIIVFIVLIILFAGFYFMLFTQPSGDWETYISGERERSIGTLVLTFLQSPVFLILTLEIWLTLFTYFSLHHILHRLKVSADQVQWIKGIAVTVIQLIGVLTLLIGFGWWANLDLRRYEIIHSFSYAVLSPTTVLLTFGMIIVLFISLNKILVIDENVGEHEQIAGKMIIVLLSIFILLSLMGGSLSLAVHYERSVWTNLR